MAAPGGAGAEEALARALRGREQELADLGAELARARARAGDAGAGAGDGREGGAVTPVTALALDAGVHREFCQMKDEITQARTRIKVDVGTEAPDPPPTPPARPDRPSPLPPSLRSHPPSQPRPLLCYVQVLAPWSSRNSLGVAASTAGPARGGGHA